MTRISATTLDLSRYPAPLAIRGIDFETILAERKARLGALFTAAGIAFDVQQLETDPAIILQETDAYRELMVVAHINDAVRAVMVAFAVGSDLEHMGARFGVTRRVITAATDDAPAVLESDAELRRRVLLAPEAFAAAGPAAAYIFHALNADARVLNVDIEVPSPGVVSIAIQARAGDGVADAGLIETVQRYLTRPDIKPLTDTVHVNSITNVPYTVTLEAFVLPGPDPDAIHDLIVGKVQAMAAARRTPSRDMPRSAVIAAAQIDPVDKVILTSPSADVARGFGEVAVLSGLNVTVTQYDG